MNDSAEANLQDTTAVIEAFGGIRPMAHKLDVPVSTVQGWKQRNAFPENRVDDILAAAAAHDVDLAAIAAVMDTSKITDTDALSGPDEAPPVPTEETPLTSRAELESSGGVPRRKDRGAFLIAVIALVIAVAASGWVVLGGGQTAPGTDSTDIAERLKVLETAPKTSATDASQQQLADDIANLRAAIDQIAKTQTESTEPTEDIDQLATRLQLAETKLDQIQRQSASEAQRTAAALSATQDDIMNLLERLAAVDTNSSSTGETVAGAVGLALAAGRLQRVMDNGDPYEDVLATLRTLSADDAAIGAILDRLTERAGAGVPTRDALVRAFPGVARDVAAAAGGDAANSWIDRTMQRIRNTVSVRRIGSDVPGDELGARIARAEAKLLSGDLSGAVAELDGLEAGAASATATWLDGARARLDAEIAIGQLEAAAISRLQASNGGS